VSISTEERFSERHDVREALHTLKHAVGDFGADIAQLAPGPYDGVLFALNDTPDQKKAGIIVLEEPPQGYSDTQRKFAHSTLLNRHFEYAGTGLESAFTDTRPQFTSSRLVEAHIPWGAPVQKTGRAAVQVAFDQRRGDMSLEDGMNKLWNEHQPRIEAAFTPLRRIQENTDNLLGKLELNPAVQPNAFVARWDIIGSTEMALKKPGVYQAYVDHTKRAFKDIMKSTGHSVDELGDGQNLMIPIKPHMMFDVVAQRVMLSGMVLPLVDRLMSTHTAIAALYPELSPRALFAVSMGNIFPDDEGLLTGEPLYEASRGIKSLKRGETLALTPSVKSIELVVNA